MIEVELIGGLGNNMFQYALGKIIAKEKNYNLDITNINNLSSFFTNVQAITDKQSKTENTLNIGYNSSTGHIQNVCLNEVLNHSGKIALKGFFQKYYLYEQHREDLQNTFYIKNFVEISPEDLVVHIRLGDYVALQQQLSLDVYINIIKSLSYRNCILVTDDVNHFYIQTLLKEIPNCYTANTLYPSNNYNSLILDYLILLNAKQLLISQSTFSWWAAFLGNQDKVYVPLYTSSAGYPWKLVPDIDDIDLIPSNGKFVKIPI